VKPLTKILAVALICSSCQKNTLDAPAPLKEETTLNASYGADPMHKMDIYLPAGRTTTSTKVLILIHGGGWNAGDKNDFNTYIDTLKKRLPAYAIFNINYRLATGPPNLFPAQENDVKLALQFIYDNKNTYNISDKFVLLGASAGGHLALLQAYKYTIPVKIKAVVDFFGPTELVSMYNNPPNPLIPLLLFQVTGGTPATQTTLYQQSSPFNFITAQSPPTIILHGGLDIAVAPSQSVLLKNQLQALGVTHQYVYYPTEGHGWTGPILVDSFDKITAFINTNVN
jgi:acetyl esterase/lipase